MLRQAHSVGQTGLGLILGLFLLQSFQCYSCVTTIMLSFKIHMLKDCRKIHIISGLEEIFCNIAYSKRMTLLLKLRPLLQKNSCSRVSIVHKERKAFLFTGAEAWGSLVARAGSGMREEENAQVLVGS